MLESFSLPPIEANSFAAPAIILHIQGEEPARIEVQERGQILEQRVEAQQVCIMPSGWYGKMRIKDSSTFVQVRLQPDLLMRRIDEKVRPQNAEVRTWRGVSDPQLLHICLALEHEARAGGESGRLFADSLATALAARLMARYSATSFQPVPRRGGLPKYALRLATDYIHANLNRDIRLSELAELVHMSAYHFARLFRQSMGVAPYHYVILQRVERAKVLLSDRALSIADVAAVSGFQSQSHFTAVFRRLTELTPRQYRNST